jgi:hypothetical protein
MIKRKCKNCSKKISKKFNYCPWCGLSFKQEKERTNFGMLGRKDDNNPFGNEIKLPFGLNKIMGSLLKQLETEIQNSAGNQQNQKGIRIEVMRGMPKQMKLVDQNMQERPKVKSLDSPISEAEKERRMNLPKIEAESRLKRIGDEIIFELKVPGIKSKKNISFDIMEKGTGIRAYTKEACYTKVLPITPDNLEFSIKKDLVIIESRT